MSSSRITWTPQFTEQFAREWLKHEILLPEPCTDGMSKYRIKAQRSVAWRDMFAKLGIEQHRPTHKLFLQKYKRMLSQLVSRVRARTVEEVLCAAPDWVRTFDARFHIVGKVLAEHQVRRCAVPDRSSVLLGVLCAMRAALDGGVVGVGRSRSVWTGATRAAAEQCGYPLDLVQGIWHGARTVCLAKLRVLQSTGDRTVCGRGGNSLTAADWLAVDMVLLYDDKEKLLTEESMLDNDQASTLTALFSLVQRYDLEHWALASPDHAPDTPVPALAPPVPALAPPVPALAPPVPVLAPPVPALAPPNPALAPPNPALAPPVPALAPPVPALGTPVPALAPPVPALGPPDPALAPPNPALAPPVPALAPPVPALASHSPSLAPPNPALAPPNPALSPPNPALTPLDPAVTPPDPASAPSNPALVPSNLALTSSDPALTPSDPALAPSDPALTSSDPALTPSDPALTPSDPALTSSDPALTSSDPTLTPSDPTHTPLEPALAPPDPAPPVLSMHERWMQAAHAYTYSGRVCSLVVLQRRWLELVRMTRALLAARRRADTNVRPLCAQLARRFPSLITGRVASWPELVRSGRVYTQDHTAPTVVGPLPPPPFPLDDEHTDPNADDDDIVLIERDIETIDLADLDSSDETDQLIIDERIQMEELLPTQQKTEKKEPYEQQKVLEKRRQHICDNLDNELDSTLKDIIKQHKETESEGVTSSVSCRLFKKENIVVKSELKDLTNIKIDLTETESLDETASSENFDISSLQTEIDLVEDDSVQGNLEHIKTKLKKEISTRKPTHKTPAFNLNTHSEKGNLNKEMIESVLKKLTETTCSQQSSNSVFEQLDPSVMEAKIIFSDDDDNCDVNESTDQDVDSNTSSPASTQDQINNEQNHIVIKDLDLTLKKSVPDANVKMELEDHIINLDTDNSDSETNIDKTTKTPIKQDKDVDESNTPIINKSKTPNSPAEKCMKLNQETFKKKRIGPKSFMESLKHRSQENDISQIGSVAIIDKNTPETESVVPIVVDNPTIISDRVCKNILEVSCKNEISSDDEDSGLVIAEDIEQNVKIEPSVDADSAKISSKLSFEEEIVENGIKDDIESKSVIRQIIVNESLGKIVDNSHSKLESTIIKNEKTKSIETLQGYKSKLSFEPDDTPTSKNNNDTDAAIGMDVDEPASNIDKDENSNEAPSSACESEHSKDFNENNDNFSTEIMPKVEDTTENAVEEENKNHALGNREGDEDDATGSCQENINLDQLLMAVRIPLYRIDEFTFWKRGAKDSTIDHRAVDPNRTLVPKLQIARRLKPGLRPSGWAAAHGQVGSTSRRQSFNPYVRLTRLPYQVVHGYLVSQQCWEPEAELDGSGRARKKVELADIEEVRRINRRLLTAQVKPLTQASESDPGSDTEHCVPEPDCHSDTASALDATDADNTLTPEELDDVLNKLKMWVPRRPPPPPAAPPGPPGPRAPSKYCCLARRHISYNRARARLAARSGKQSQDRDLHNMSADRSHADLSCSCCCLGALKAETRRTLRLASGQRALEAALKRLVRTQKGSQPGPAPVPAPPTPPSAASAASDDSDDDLPLIRQKLAKSKVTCNEKRRVEKKKRESQTKKKKSIADRKNKEKEEAKQAQLKDEYDEWMRQRNMFAKYFTINPSSGTTSSRPQHSVTVRPRLPNSTPANPSIAHKKRKLTKEMLDLHEQSQDRQIVSKRFKKILNNENEVLVSDHETKKINTEKAKKETHAGSAHSQTFEMSADTSEHSCVKPPAVVIEPTKESQNKPTAVSKPSPPVRKLPRVIMIKPIVPEHNDPPANTRADTQNQQISNTECLTPTTGTNKPPASLASFFMAKNINILPLDQNLRQQTAQQQTQSTIKVVSNSPPSIQQPTDQQPIPLEPHETTKQPNQSVIVTINQPQQPTRVLQLSPLKRYGTNKPKQPTVVTINQQPRQITGVQQPISLEPAGTINQPNQPYQPVIVSVNQTQQKPDVQQTNPVEPTETTNQYIQLILKSTIEANNQPQIFLNHTQLETQNASQINIIQPTSDPKTQKVTRVTGQCNDQTISLWNYSENKVLLKTLIETSQATPGYTFVRVLHSPQVTDTVLATCQTKPENPNQSDLQIITQTANMLVKPHLATQPSTRGLNQAGLNSILLVNDGKQTPQTIQESQLRTLVQSDKAFPSMMNTKQVPVYAEQVIDISTDSDENSKDKSLEVDSSMPVIINVTSMNDKNMPLLCGGINVDTIDLGALRASDTKNKNTSDLDNASKLSPNTLPSKTPIVSILIGSKQEGDSIETPFTCKNGVSDSSTVYVEDLVKYVERSKTPPDEVSLQILGVVINQKMFKLLGRYLLINEIVDQSVQVNNLILSFWTLKPRLNLSQILFSKAFKSQKRKMSGSHYHFSSMDGAARNPAGVASAVRAARNPADLFASDGRWYKKLSESPLVFAQVLTVVSTAIAAGSLLVVGAQLHLLDLREEGGGPWRIHRTSKHENGKLVINLYCAHAPEAMQELERELRQLKVFSSSKGEATVSCHFVGQADAASSVSIPSDGVIKHAGNIDSISPHSTNSSGVLPNAGSSGSVTSHSGAANDDVILLDSDDDS